MPEKIKLICRFFYPIRMIYFILIRSLANTVFLLLMSKYVQMKKYNHYLTLWMSDKGNKDFSGKKSNSGEETEQGKHRFIEQRTLNNQNDT